MAIKNIRIITGIAGGVGALLNVGTGADKTWPSSGNPTFANSGCYYTFAEGTGLFQLLGANAGTFKPWGTGADAKPAGATGNSFIEMPSAHTGQCVAFMANTDSTALNSTLTDGAGTAEIDFENGYLVSCWVQWWTDETTFSSLAGSLSPAHNPGALSMHEFKGAVGSTKYQTRMNPYNVGGFAPSIVLSDGGYTGTNTYIVGTGGFSSSLPNGHLAFNRWYKFQVWARRATGAAATDGEIRVYLSGRLVFQMTNVNVWATDGNYLETFFGLLSGFTTARTGCRFRYACPIKVQSVPEADLPTAVTEEWTENTTRDMAMRRLWPVQFTKDRWSVTSPNGGTLPTIGRVINTGGTFPGRAEAIFRGTSGKKWTSEFPSIWDGTIGTKVAGPDGRVHVNFLSAVPNGGKVTWRVYAADNTTELIKVLFDDSGTGTLQINGSTVLTGRTALPANSRWQLMASLKAGECRVTLHNLADASKLASMARTITVSSIYDGGAIGKPTYEIEIGSGGGSMSHQGAGAWARPCALFGDSYKSSNTTEPYAVSAVNQGTKTVTVGTMGSRNPSAGDKVYWTGSAGNVNDGTYTVASSTATTVTFVESIPNASVSGSINLVWPQFHCAAQRLGSYIIQSGDADSIPNGYDPCPFGMTILAGFHAAINFARSGCTQEQDLVNWLPNCTELPPLWALSECFVVNSTTATATEANMNAEAISVAANKRLLTDWVASRGGTMVTTDSPNLQDAGFVVNGTANRFRRRTPRQIDEIYKADLRSVVGNVFHASTMSRLDANAVNLTDGIHVDPATALLQGYELHAGLNAQKGAPGFNLDGSIKRTRRSSGGPVVSPLA